jgi:dihydrolipoamide dehydrogenase
LLGKAGAEVITGWGTMTDGKTCEVVTTAGDTVTIRSEHVILATGSVPIELPSLPFGGNVVSSAGLLALDAVPERLVVIGGGYIGLELGTAFAKFGANVTVVEATDRLLGQYDADLVAPVRRSLERLGVRVLLDTRALDLTDGGDALRVQPDGGEITPLGTDCVLVTIGRRSRLDGWGRENLVLDLDGTSVAIDADGRTSMRNVWAIGDVTGEPMLAHRATAQAEVVAELIAGHRAHFDPVAIPSVVFTDPEIATVGQSPAEAAAEGIETNVGQFPFSANGRAMTLNRVDGFVRVVARRSDGVILGIQAVGAGVADLVDTFTLALEMGAVIEDLAASIAAHPTQAEALHEAALLALGRGLHL